MASHGGRILILGGYGNFGKRIARALTAKTLPVIICGRDRQKADTLVRQLPDGLAEPAIFDAFRDLDAWLKKLKPAVVVHTCGPFQNSAYFIAETCICNGVAYVDLADGRDFVAGILALDQAARKNNVAVLCGASTVPGLSSAVLDHLTPQFAEMRALKFGISPGQKAERGLATTTGILSYVGKRLRPYAGHRRTVYGWQDIYRQDYPGLGTRWMANCEIPDLDLFPPRYGLQSIRFSAGMELGFLHLGLWLLSWGVRLGVPLNLSRHAPLLLAVSNWFNGLGSADGGMHMILEGQGKDGGRLRKEWYIIARDGDGPQIPTVPAILLAARLARGETKLTGVHPCVGLITLEDYLSELRGFDIEIHEV